MAFVSTRRNPTVEVLYENKEFSYDNPPSRLQSSIHTNIAEEQANPYPSFSSETLSASRSLKTPFDDFKLPVGNRFRLDLGGSKLLTADYNDYDAIDVISIPKDSEEYNRPLFLEVVSNHFDFVNNFQILLVGFETHLEVFSLEIIGNNEFTEDEQDHQYGKKPKTDIKFSIKKVQECLDIRPYGIQIQCCTMSHVSCISSVTKKVTYAFAVLGSETFFLVREEATKLTKNIEITSNNYLVNEIDNPNRSAVTHMAFSYPEGPELLAYLDDIRVCTVLDINTELPISTFPLKSPGVSLSFHPSEMYKLMVAEMAGLITIFNVAKQCAIQSINLQARITTLHWCSANPVMIAVGSVEDCLVIDLSKPYADPSRNKPYSNKTIQKIEFSERDPTVMVMLGKPEAQIKLFRANESTHTWTKTDRKICTFTWLVGVPYLVGLTEDNFCIYDTYH